MKYKVQRAKKGGFLPPEGWTEIEAENMEAAAVTYLQANPPPTVAEYPLMVYVSDGKLLHHPNGAPMCVHGYLFQLDIVENNK